VHVHLPVLNGGAVTMKLSTVQTQEALAVAEDQTVELASVREALVKKETTIDQLRAQVETLLHEVTSLSDAYARLQVAAAFTSAVVSSCDFFWHLCQVAF